MIQIENLSKQYGKNEILRQITVRFESGGIYGLIGANGCGKTTLMRCICGFSQPTTGYVLVNGCLVGGRRALRRNPALQRSGAVSETADFAPKTGVIIESPGFLPNESGLTNLMLLADMSGRADRADARRAMETLGLSPDECKPVGWYSLGMRQRLGFAQAIMENPDVLVLDEPFNAMDRDERRARRFFWPAIARRILRRPAILFMRWRTGGCGGLFLRKETERQRGKKDLKATPRRTDNAEKQTKTRPLDLKDGSWHIC